MADERHPEQPSDLPPSVEALGATEAQLDAALTGAAVHVDQLQQSVGPPTAPTDTVERMLDRGGPASLPAVIDSQLDEIDQLLAETSKQLGSKEAFALAEAGKANEPVRAAPMPDFMSDLMGSEAPAKTPGQVQATAPTAGSQVAGKDAGSAGVPDFMSEFTQGDAATATRPGSVAVSSASVREHELTASTSAAAPVGKSAVTATQAIPEVPRQGTVQEAPRAARSRPLYAVADFAVAMLEVFDRPFRRFTSRTREVLGWLALIALATAALVFVLSLF